MSDDPMLDGADAHAHAGAKAHADIVERTIARLRAAGCVFAEEEAGLLFGSGATGVALEAMVAHRGEGKPLEYILGWTWFCGLRIRVAKGVFVPRQRSALLVTEATAAIAALPTHSAHGDEPSIVLDLCCGTGALGAAVRASVEAAGGAIEVWAADLDPVAAECARTNLGLGADRVFSGDLFEPLPERLRGTLDIILCNTPYVPSSEIGMLPPEARDHEPLAALDGGTDGLDVQRRVAAEASAWLAPGGTLFVESSEHQAPASAAIFASNGLEPRIVFDEELGATIVAGRKPLDVS